MYLRPFLCVRFIVHVCMFLHICALLLTVLHSCRRSMKSSTLTHYIPTPTRIFLASLKNAGKERNDRDGEIEGETGERVIERETDRQADTEKGRNGGERVKEGKEYIEMERYRYTGRNGQRNGNSLPCASLPLNIQCTFPCCVVISNSLI